MKLLTDHLPKTKQAELGKIASIICEYSNDVEMIILFGSYARGDWKEAKDLKPERKSGHISDYDILVVTGQKDTAKNYKLWKQVAQACSTQEFSAHPRIITHDIQELNIKLAEGQYFYTDVKNEGCVLYNADKNTLADKRELTAEEKQRIAQDYYDHWFVRANEFFDDFTHNLNLDRYEKAAFELHQAVESSYKTILLVFTRYNPNEHLLELLGQMVSDHDEGFSGVFPQETQVDQERFELLDYAYIGARYDPRYRISQEDLEALSLQVKTLLELTEKACKEKIKSFVPCG